LPISQKAETTLTADSVLAELKAGNEHHVRHQYQHPHETATRQRELTNGQHPHAQILGCSDSRVPPEIIFDQGLGDLFVVRVAGNVATDTELGSLEYGAEHLHIPLIVVLGHESCGAVTAAVQGGEVEGHITALLSLLKPAVEKSRRDARRPGRECGARKCEAGRRATASVRALSSPSWLPREN
jgi:carbonic anhydrase